MSAEAAAQLVVAYNADAGVVAGALDILHKIVSPATYPCALCALTHGTVTIDRRWRDWRRSAPLPVAVFHRPDFRAAYPALAAEPLPLIARDAGDRFDILLDAALSRGWRRSIRSSLSSMRVSLQALRREQVNPVLHVGRGLASPI